MGLIKVLCVISITVDLANSYVHLEKRNPAFDLNFYENALDPELCDEQLQYIANDATVRLQFLDAGLRLPRNIMKGNLLDLGSYYPCLEIHKQTESSIIEGKYCMINVPLDQNLELPTPEIPWPEIPWPEIPWPELPWPELNPNNTENISTLRKLKESQSRMIGAQMLTGEIDERLRSSALLEGGIQLQMSFCLPKTCTTRQALDSLYFNTTVMGFEYQDAYCRLPNDKPWVPADYVAVVIFSIIGLLTVLSTGYDLYNTLYVGKDSKSTSTLCKSFSVYTNTRRLLTFPKNPGALECMDGLRMLAMMWVILGHTFSSQLLGNNMIPNPMDAIEWITSAKALWITAAPITVDTFFMFSGLLLVYTTCGKLTGSKLLKNIHLFYLNRFLRMFPLLALTILLQVSILHRVADGPNWTSVLATKVERCRTYWWSTMLYVQNYVSPNNICLGHSWYLAVDMQLHILSPIVLFWVLSKRRIRAWVSMTTALLATLVAATAFNFYKNFPAGTANPSRIADTQRYMFEYYYNTLTRAAPFFVGMMYGYILHLYRGRSAEITKMQAGILWMCAAFLLGFVIYLHYPVAQADFDNQVIDNLINSFMRAIWAFALGWIVFACVHGYGGPLNWLLSLPMWKLPSRLSYAMYLLHYPLIYVMNGSMVTPTYFSVPHSIFKFFGDFTLAFTVAFVATLIIDSPFSTIIKLVLGGGGPKKSQPTKLTEKRGVVANEKQAYNNYGFNEESFPKTKL